MEIVEFSALPEREAVLAKLDQCEWAAGRYLAKQIREGTLFQAMGDGTKLLLLMDEGELVSVATLSRRDAIQDEALYPWIGFVYTQKRYRGRRYSQRVIGNALMLARAEGYQKVYLSTEEIGLYEKYGFIYLENRTDIWGKDSRIYYYPLWG